MCGIAGIVHPRGAVCANELHQLAGRLTHRGPDDQGVYRDPLGRCGFAFRRLSIIDLTTGHQPLANESGRVWVMLNGEIYNFPELRRDLAASGHQFATQSDTEAIAHLYEELGPGCFERLAGMFVIAIWDEERGELLLARDRFGKKPLVYSQFADGRLVFASEAKSLLALQDADPRLDAQSLHRYLVFQYVPAPHSIFQGFRKLMPGCWLRVRPTTNGELQIEEQAYWRLPKPSVFAGTYADARAQLGELLTSAVRKRLLSDVPLGAFLSGGIDSSVVVGLMRRLDVNPLRTFSIGFPDARYDETRHARRVAEHFQTEHQQFTVTPQAREVLDTLAYHYDEPFGDSSAIPTYYVSRCTRERVTVALTGDAGDECFGGYDRYRATVLAEKLARLPRGVRAGLVVGAGWLPREQPRSFGSRAHRFLGALGQTPARRYLNWMRIFDPEWLSQAYKPEFRAQLDFGEPLEWFDDMFEAGPGTAVERAIYTDFLSYLPYDLLTKVDIASMACSLECRAPFLDHELVEFALSLPIEWRVGLRGSKRILKDWATDLLPPEILWRSKMGFGVPIRRWLRADLQDLVQDCILGPDCLAAHVLRREPLEALVAEHMAGRANREHQLWLLLMMEMWRRRWKPRI